MTMSPPAALEQVLAQHGDMLYRVALVLTGDSERAASALRVAMQRATQATPPLLDAEGLLRTLIAVVDRQSSAKRPRRPRRPTIVNALYGGPGVFAPFDALPLVQRAALAVHLLLGYDMPAVARMLGTSEDTARETLAAGIASLATRSGTALPDAQPTEVCPTVRAAVMRAPERIITDPALRGHLALCSACRAFETAWSDLTNQIEVVLRSALRAYTLPADLAAQLVRGQQPAPNLLQRVLAGGRWGFTLVPLGVLVLIGALVLPGFWRSAPVTQLTNSAPLAEPRGLVQQALAQVAQPPAGTGVWHAQWETLWFFPDGKYAPIVADAWLDSHNHARHRLQLVHGAGGALYELQVGDGDRALWYALSPTYYSSLYGANVSAPNAPQLVYRSMDVPTQQRALDARFGAGAWDVGPSYLRQAYSSPDLHTLGRQLDGTHAVQILSFTGISPLGLPPDDPQVTLKNITVLLALDSSDGRLRSVTELSGPPGGEQTSRVTWRLRNEEWLTTETQARAAFDAARAWNGQGQFSAEAQGASADPALPLYDQQHIVPPERILSSLPLPATMPVGAERVVLWSPDDDPLAQWPSSLRATYLGPGRRVTVSWDEQRFNIPGVALPDGSKISSSRGYHYLLTIHMPISGPQPPTDVILDSNGYTRAELLAIAQTLRPLDMNRWRSQQQFFAPAMADPQAHGALVAALMRARPPASDAAIHRRERSFVLHANTASPPDPYHRLPYDGMPATITRDQWVRVSDAPNTAVTTFTQLQRGDGMVYSSIYADAGNLWSFTTATHVLERWPSSATGENSWMNCVEQGAIDMLAHPGQGTQVFTSTNGIRTIRRVEPFEQNMRYGWLATADPDQVAQSPNMFTDRLPSFPAKRPHFLTSEVDLSPDGSLTALRYTAMGFSDSNEPLSMLESCTLESEEHVASAAAPASLNNGKPPEAVDLLIDPDQNGTNAMIQTATLTQALPLIHTPILTIAAPGDLRLTGVDVSLGKPGSSLARSNSFDEPLLRGIAVRLHYEQPDGKALNLTEGPATLMRAFLQSLPPRWKESAVHTQAIDGRSVDIWTMHLDGSTTRWAITEVDGTLTIADTSNFPEGTVLTLLASLQRAA